MNACHECGDEAIGYRNLKWWCETHAPPALLDAIAVKKLKTSLTRSQLLAQVNSLTTRCRKLEKHNTTLQKVNDGLFGKIERLQLKNKYDIRKPAF